MTDQATWTEKFDRWWAEYRVSAALMNYAIDGVAHDAFMAGAAAERAEHHCEGQIMPAEPCDECAARDPAWRDGLYASLSPETRVQLARDLKVRHQAGSSKPLP